MKGDDDFRKLGAAHGAQGCPRYKFQDRRLQQLYNEGYDGSWEEPKLTFTSCRGCGQRMLANTGHLYCNGCRF